VIGILATDDDLAVRLSADIPVAPHHPDNRVIRLGPGAGVEHPVELRRSYFRKQPGELDGRRMGALEEAVVVRQLEHLPIRHFSDLPAAVADVHAPEAGHAIQDALAVRVVEINAFRTGDDPRAMLRQRLEVRERMKIVARIRRLPLAGAAGPDQRGLCHVM
jgi:hypothetical protein